MKGFDPHWIAPSRTALLLIDCQVDFGAPHGEMARRGMDMTGPQVALANAALLLDAARAAGVAPVFVRLVTRPGRESDVLKEEKRRKGDPGEGDLCVVGSEGAAFTVVSPLSGEMILDKTRYSAFSDTGLAGQLKGQSVDTLVLAGLTTECCVAATAWGAFEADFHVFIASDAVAAYDETLHQGSLKALSLSGALLLPAAGISTAWKNSR